MSSAGVYWPRGTSGYHILKCSIYVDLTKATTTVRRSYDVEVKVRRFVMLTGLLWLYIWRILQAPW